MKIIGALIFLRGVLFPVALMASELRWEDVEYSSGPHAGAQKIAWESRNAEQKAAYLELYYKAIVYCQDNLNKSTDVINMEISGLGARNFPRVTAEYISSLYRHYGDSGKAADVLYQYWVDSRHKPWLQNPDADPVEYVASAYGKAGRYDDLVRFYGEAYTDILNRYAVLMSTDAKTVEHYAKHRILPEELEIAHEKMMADWDEAKHLAKTIGPKPLDPAVKNHEWFYGGNPKRVLRALDYYFQNKVQFMLEKAVSHKDPIVAAKAKEYLDKLGAAGK